MEFLNSMDLQGTDFGVSMKVHLLFQLLLPIVILTWYSSHLKRIWRSGHIGHHLVNHWIIYITISDKNCHYIHWASPLIQSCSLPMPWSYEFRLKVALSPSGDLMLTSRIKNISSDSKPFQFTFAYHTYFSVSDIRYLVKCHLFALCLHQVFLTLFECKGA